MASRKGLFGTAFGIMLLLAQTTLGGTGVWEFSSSGAGGHSFVLQVVPSGSKLVVTDGPVAAWSPFRSVGSYRRLRTDNSDYSKGNPLFLQANAS